MKSLAVIDGFVRPDAIGRIFAEVKKYRFVEVHKTTESMTGGREVRRDYAVLDGQHIQNQCPDLWLIYDQATEAVRNVFNSQCLPRLYNRADFVLKDYAAPEGKQSWHRDVNPIGAVIYLTECEGGETEFEAGLSVSPRPGRLAIFDGHLAHRCATVTDGHKWAFICNWYLPGITDRPPGAEHAMLEAR